MHRGEPARPLDVCLAGVRRLRLVSAFAGQRTPLGDDLAPAHIGSYADWVDAQLLRADAPDASAAGAVREALGRVADGRRTRVVEELGAYQQAAAAEQQAMAAAPPAGAALGGAAQAGRDGTGRLIVAHRRLALVLGFGGPDHGELSVFKPEEGTTALERRRLGRGDGQWDA